MDIVDNDSSIKNFYSCKSSLLDEAGSPISGDPTKNTAAFGEFVGSINEAMVGHSKVTGSAG